MKQIKNKSILCIIILIVFFSRSIIVNANDELNSNMYNCEINKINFYNLTTDKGLSNNTITAIYQDSIGYMWIGTEDGLNKYNGNAIQEYNYGKDNKKTLTSTYITSINEGRHGSIWVGTDSGLNIIYRNQDRIEKIQSNYGEDNWLSNYKVTTIFRDSNEVMWVGTIYGLNRYDEEKGVFIQYNFQGIDKDIDNNYIIDIDEDNNGYLWVSTKKGVATIDINTYGICFEENDKYSYIYEIDMDNQGYIWIATDEGLLKISGTGAEIKEYNAEIHKSSKNDIKKVLCTKNGDVWLSTLNGLVKYDQVNKTHKKYNCWPNSDNSLACNLITYLYEDRNGVIWIGTENGLSILNVDQQFNNEINNILIENEIYVHSVTSFFQDSDDDLWIGTKGEGIIFFDTSENKVITYTSEKNALSSNFINNIFQEQNHIVVITEKGVDIINKKTGEMYKHNDKFNIDNNGLKAFKDKEYIWCAGSNGLYRYDILKDAVYSYKEHFLQYGITNYMVYDIFQDLSDENILWLAGTREVGLIKFHKTEGIIKQYLSNSTENTLSYEAINCIVGDDEGNLWIGTQAGLNKFNIKTETFTSYYEKDGLASDYINSIVIDDNDNIWIGTSGGLSKLITSENRFITFTNIDGLCGNQFNKRVAYKTKNGNLLFGTTNGIVFFNPDNIKETINKEDKVIIGQISVNRELLINKDESINLKYNENNLVIEYFFPDYKRIGGITYLVKMEGINKDWVDGGSDGYAIYTTLEPGKYTFRVKASNSDGTITEESSIDFVIKKPFWKSNVAYCLYIIIIFLTIVYYFYRLKFLKKLIEIQTKKINGQLQENKRLYEINIRNEKFKNDYFVNLSHELRTPINVILSAIEVFNSLNKAGHMTKEKTLQYIGIIKKNSEGLLNIINDIIDSSKIESGSYKINIEENVDIVYLVEETALGMSEYINSNGIQLVIDPEIEELEISCDPKEIERCIINLIGNSVKYTDENGIIKVLIKDNDDTVSISIEDNGRGISKEDQEFIFKRFEQGKSLNSIKVSGSGIGLTLVKYIVELHGGQVTLESELEKGSVFTIILPKNN